FDEGRNFAKYVWENSAKKRITPFGEVENSIEEMKTIRSKIRQLFGTGWFMPDSNPVHLKQEKRKKDSTVNTVSLSTNFNTALQDYIISTRINIMEDCGFDLEEWAEPKYYSWTIDSWDPDWQKCRKKELARKKKFLGYEAIQIANVHEWTAKKIKQMLHMGIQLWAPIHEKVLEFSDVTVHRVNHLSDSGTEGCLYSISLTSIHSGQKEETCPLEIFRHAMKHQKRIIK
ncbi:hypothetical protein FRX31_007759, partial [Thalictrum thalictroides]